MDLTFLYGHQGDPGDPFTILASNGEGPPVHLGITEPSDAFELCAQLAGWALREMQLRSAGSVTDSGGYRVATLAELRGDRSQLGNAG